MVSGDPMFTAAPVGRIALVGETYAAVRDVMIEGESGLLAIHPARSRPRWISSKRQLVWDNGAIAQVFTSEEPDGLRGPQFGAAWCDELAKWSNMEETWNMLQFTLRLGDFPRQVITTTPRPVALLKKLIADKRTVLSHSTTRENSANLAKGFLERIVGEYEGTRLGRQELEGELIEDRADGLWKRSQLELLRVKIPAQLRRIVVAVDPPITAHKSSDACGIVVVGLGADKNAYVLEDATISAASPSRWAGVAASAYHRWSADCLVAEVNQGGDMVETILHTIDETLPVVKVRATRGKWLRAEPVAALYERGKIFHVGNLSKLEDQMCDFGPNGLSSGRSPDRLDALVWAITHLMLNRIGEPKVRAT
jgi:phage terminase large subunit-like protein